MNISAAMIVRNEERCLRRCLESLRGVVDEIVVMDTGSTDATPSIAREFTERVHAIAWRDDFAAARNAAIDRCEGDWILVIDADEWILNPGEARQRLEAFTVANSADTLGTVEIRSTLPVALGGGEAILRAPRFFARGRFRYEGAIHEQLGHSGNSEMGTTGVVFGHSGYAQEPDDPHHKSLRNKRILIDEIRKHPTDEYLWFQLGKACFALRAHADAVAAFDRALALIRFDRGATPMGLQGPVAPDVVADLLATAAYAHVNNGQLDNAITLLERHRALGHAGFAFADVPHALGYAYLMRGDVPRARAAYEDSLRLGPLREQVTGTGSFASHYHLGLLAEAENDIPRAVTHYLEALRMNSAYGPAIARCLDLAAERPGCLPEDWHECVKPSALTVELRKRPQTGGGT
ncbi:MAG TPA: glycosyltransferase [Candidatus Hydrogenedentes bacterium]|nr:glycosyltransferase [Candidatus Hydrogenedentota bacterium]